MKIFKILQKSKTFGNTFCNFEHQKSFPEVTRVASKHLGPIGSAVFTFIGHKRTDKHTSKVYAAFVKEYIKVISSRLRISIITFVYIDFIDSRRYINNLNKFLIIHQIMQELENARTPYSVPSWSIYGEVEFSIFRSGNRENGEKEDFSVNIVWNEIVYVIFIKL